ncbi:hypothetical protein [Massiliimalia massiliensis]|jgi:hypothetical protein|uniref:hypothetical protein n=1 Tax=Massiliimalia massiliensis TaxID=1852384 RepID=UPI0009861909|nr:hypothetical protein [Massiliimalia massiliensis]
MKGKKLLFLFLLSAFIMSVCSGCCLLHGSHEPEAGYPNTYHFTVRPDGKSQRIDLYIHLD